MRMYMSSVKVRVFTNSNVTVGEVRMGRLKPKKKKMFQSADFTDKWQNIPYSLKVNDKHQNIITINQNSALEELCSRRR